MVYIPKYRINVNSFKKYLEKKSEQLKNYRLVFYNQTKRRLNEIAREIVRLARLDAPMDTGTLRTRIDYKQLRWNQIQFGIYEDASHPPTANISRYTGKVRRADEVYGYYVHENHKTKAGFLYNNVDEHYARLVKEFIRDFNDDYFSD